MSIISEVQRKLKSGIPLAKAIPAGADPDYWSRIIKNPPKPTKRTTSQRRSTKRQGISHALATSLTAYQAEAEKVRRVNSANSAPDEPFMTYSETLRRQRLADSLYPDFYNGVA